MEEPVYAWQVPAKPTKQVRKKRTDRRHDWSEKEVFDRLGHVFPKSSCVIVPQIANATGFGPGRRKVDALVASVYPSRGLWIAGVEIKITKSDWRAELREPEKSLAISQHCDFWYMACPAGVIPEPEVPELWGLIEVRRDGATIVKRPVRNENVLDFPSGMVCSILRAAAGIAMEE